MPMNFDRGGRVPDQGKPAEMGKAERRFSDTMAFVSQRAEEIDRALAACEGIEATGSRHPQYADARFRKTALELQQQWLEVLERMTPSEEATTAALNEIQERLGVIDAVDATGKHERMIRAERQELVVMQAALRSRIEKPESASPPESVVVAAAVPERAGDSQTSEKHPEAVQAKEVDWVILRPDAMEQPIVRNEDAPEWVLRMGAPRLAMLRDILGEMGQHYREIIGQVDPDSMREHPYHGFDIAKLQRAVFVNDDYGQATYIVQGERPFESLSRLSKRELRMFTNARRISYPGDSIKWREIIEHALTNDLEGERIGRDHLSLAQIHRILQENYGLRRMHHDVLIGLLEKLAQQPEFSGMEYRRDTGKTSRAGNVVYEYDPEFVERAVDYIVVFTKPNEGWKTIGAVKELATELLHQQGKQSVDHLTVSNMLDACLHADDAAQRGLVTQRYLGNGTPSAEDQKNNDFGLRSHFSPELVKIVVERIVREAPPVGWSTINAIATRLEEFSARRNDEVIRQKAIELAAANPEEFQTGEYRDTGPKRKKFGSDLNFFCNPALSVALIQYFSHLASDRKRK